MKNKMGHSYRNRSADMAEMTISHITHSYSSRSKAVDDVCAKLEGHRITGLLGANGAGKSTLMNIICGVLTPTSGDVTINGYSILTDPVNAKRQIGFLPQKPPLLQDLTIEEYLRYSADLRMVEDRNNAVEEAMEKCRIGQFRNRLIKNLSGGFQQRVGIAQALIHRPSCIVLDEPTNGLDPIQIVEIRNLIREISGSCMVLLSTHILHEVQLTCDDILMMSSGRLVFNGSLDEFTRSIHQDALLVAMGSMPPEQELLGIDGILSVSRAEGHPGFTRLSISGDPDAMCERIIAMSAERGWHLREIVKDMPSADDVFKYLDRH